MSVAFIHKTNLARHLNLCVVVAQPIFMAKLEEGSRWIKKPRLLSPKARAIKIRKITTLLLVGDNAKHEQKLLENAKIAISELSLKMQASFSRKLFK